MRGKQITTAILSAVFVVAFFAACGSSQQSKNDDVEKPAFVQVEYDGPVDDGTVVSDVNDFNVTIHYENGTTSGGSVADDCKLMNPATLKEGEDYEFQITCHGVSGSTTVEVREPAKKRMNRAYAVCGDGPGILVGPNQNKDGTLRLWDIESLNTKQLSCVLEEMDASDDVLPAIVSKKGAEGKYQMEDAGAYYYWDVDKFGRLSMVIVGDFPSDYGTVVTE